MADRFLLMAGICSPAGPRTLNAGEVPESFPGGLLSLCQQRVRAR